MRTVTYTTTVNHRRPPAHQTVRPRVHGSRPPRRVVQRLDRDTSPPTLVFSGDDRRKSSETHRQHSIRRRSMVALKHRSIVASYMHHKHKDWLQQHKTSARRLLGWSARPLPLIVTWPSYHSLDRQSAT